MTRDELEHAIRASCEVADDTEVWVFGSQAILGEYPDAPAFVRQSMEIDIAPRNHPERTDLMDLIAYAPAPRDLTDSQAR